MSQALWYSQSNSSTHVYFKQVPLIHFHLCQILGGNKWIQDMSLLPEQTDHYKMSHKEYEKDIKNMTLESWKDDVWTETWSEGKGGMHRNGGEGHLPWEKCVLSTWLLRINSYKSESPFPSPPERGDSVNLRKYLLYLPYTELTLQSGYNSFLWKPMCDYARYMDIASGSPLIFSISHPCSQNILPIQTYLQPNCRWKHVYIIHCTMYTKDTWI